MVMPRPAGDESGSSLVTFTADGVAADAVVATITSAFEAAGMRCGPARDLGGAVTIAVKEGRRRFGVLLGELPDEPRWLLSISSGVRPVMAMLGARADDERRTVAETVHAALAAHPAIGGLRWYTAVDWRDRRHDRARPTPSDGADPT